MKHIGHMKCSGRAYLGGVEARGIEGISKGAGRAYQPSQRNTLGLSSDP
jgi:hypothetical protein